MSEELATLSMAQHALAEVETPIDAKGLYDKLETLSQYAKRYRLDHEKQNEIAEAKLRTARKGGKLLAETVEHRGGRLAAATKAKLPEGFSQALSSRWQALASLDNDEFEAFLRETDELTLQAALNRAGRGERDRRLRKERSEALEEAQKTLEAHGEDSCRIEHGDIASWRPSRFGISCVITDPPYITEDAVELHSQLADFAVDVLPTHGALVVMTWQPLLPAVFQAMQRPELVWRWMACWQFATKERTPERAPRVFDGWKPILVFHKDGWTEQETYLYDTVISRDADKSSHEWGQSIGGFRQLVRAFSKPGETVCDPFVGGGTTSLASLAEARLFIGCDVDESAVATARQRLAA